MSGYRLQSLILGVMIRHAVVRFFEFVWLPTFDRTSRKLLSRDDERCERIYMILAYRKGMKETLTRADENALRRLSAQLKKEEC